MAVQPVEPRDRARASSPATRRRSRPCSRCCTSRRTRTATSRAEAIEEIAELLDLTPALVLGTCSFYTMFKLEPVGKLLVSVCTNVSCLVNGGPDLLGHLQRHYADDPDVTVEEVECIAACDLAPVLQVNYEFHGPLTGDTAVDADRALQARRAGRPHHLRHRGEVVERRRSGRRRLMAARDAHHHQVPARASRRLVHHRRRARERRVRRAAQGAHHGPRGHRRRGHRLGSARPRRRRVRHRPEVVVPAQGRVPPLPRGQRRRRRAVHLQGPHAGGGRPAPVDRGHRHQRRSRSRPTTRSSTCAASSAWVPSVSATRWPRPTSAGSSARTSSARATTSRSSSTAARAATSPATRRACSPASRASARCRASSRRSRRCRACTRRPRS